MSFLDRVTKAVSETVDRGKKEVDQFMRIQKVKGEITDAEKAIDEARNRIQQIKVRLADAALGMLRNGSVSAEGLSPYAADIDGVEQEIGKQQALIAEKKEEIEEIKAEDQTPKPVVVAPPAAVPPPITSAPSAPAAAAVPPPITSAPLAPAAATEAPAASPGPDVVPPPLPLPTQAAAVEPPAATAHAGRTCANCGNPVAETAAFCGECGTKVG